MRRGQLLEQPLQLGDGQQLAGGVVGACDGDGADVGLAGGGLEQRVDAAALDAHGAPVRAAGHEREQRIGGPVREQLLAGLEQRARGGAEQLGGAVAEDQALGIDAVALGEPRAQVAAAEVRIAVQPAARDERDRADDAGVRQLGPGGEGEVQRLDARERLAPALGGLLAQFLVDLLLGHPLELAVVVEQAHGGGVVLAARGALPAVRARGALVLAHWPPPRTTRLAPGPWMTRNHSMNAPAQTTAVAAKIRPSTPVR